MRVRTRATGDGQGCTSVPRARAPHSGLFRRPEGRHSPAPGVGPTPVTQDGHTRAGPQHVWGVEGCQDHVGDEDRLAPGAPEGLGRTAPGWHAQTV